MANVTVILTVTEFCTYSGVAEAELDEIVGLGVIHPRNIDISPWLFDERALATAHRALRLRRELELDWPGIAVVLTLLEENEQLIQENQRLKQKLARYI